MCCGKENATGGPGDSIAWGQGAARERDRLASRLTDALTVRGFDVESQVFAVPGARSSGLSAQVVRAVSWQPAPAVVVIGANDLTHLVPPDQADVLPVAGVPRRATASAMTLGAMMKHVAVVESSWFEDDFSGGADATFRHRRLG